MPQISGKICQYFIEINYNDTPASVITIVAIEMIKVYESFVRRSKDHFNRSVETPTK